MNSINRRISQSLAAAVFLFFVVSFALPGCADAPAAEEDAPSEVEAPTEEAPAVEEEAPSEAEAPTEEALAAEEEAPSEVEAPTEENDDGDAEEKKSE